jgi:hypothetical protein
MFSPIIIVPPDANRDKQIAKQDLEELQSHIEELQSHIGF